MTTSRQKRIQSELRSGEPFSPGTLAYFESRTLNDWYDFVVTKFLKEEAAGRITRAQLARRIRKDPAVITRLLSSPANWTLSTVSVLLLGIAGEESVPASRSVLAQAPSNAYPDWVTPLALNEIPQSASPQEEKVFGDWRQRVSRHNQVENRHSYPWELAQPESKLLASGGGQ